MPDRSRKSTKPPPDLNEIAKAVVDSATDPEGKLTPDHDKNPAAVALGKLGGLKGGAARAKKLSAKRRSQIARKAAMKRWSMKKPPAPG